MSLFQRPIRGQRSSGRGSGTSGWLIWGLQRGSRLRAAPYSYPRTGHGRTGLDAWRRLSRRMKNIDATLGWFFSTCSRGICLPCIDMRCRHSVSLLSVYHQQSLLRFAEYSFSGGCLFTNSVKTQHSSAGRGWDESSTRTPSGCSSESDRRISHLNVRSGGNLGQRIKLKKRRSGQEAWPGLCPRDTVGGGHLPPFAARYEYGRQ